MASSGWRGCRMTRRNHCHGSVPACLNPSMPISLTKSMARSTASLYRGLRSSLSHLRCGPFWEDLCHVEAQSELGLHALHTEDEWGWSSSKTGQENFLMMHVIHPNVTGPSFAQLSSFIVETDATTSVQRELFPRG